MRKANAASIAIFHEGAVLLVRRAFAPYTAHWSLPGGRIEAGESVEEGLRREIREELAIELGAILPVTEQDLSGFRLAVFTTVFARRPVPLPNEEIAALDWVAVNAALPVPTTPNLADIVEAACIRLTRV